jgi:mannosyltransferase OCH1-like enzyme
MDWGELGLQKTTLGRVPKIIHQVWVNDDPVIPEVWQRGADAWRATHPTWTYFLWTKQNVRPYMCEKHPEYLELFDSYPYEIMRIDMVRYFFLYDFGGVYCDLDDYPVTSIEPYLETGAQAYFVLVNSGYMYINSLMASRRGAPIWLEVHAELRLRTRNPWWCVGKHLTVMMGTGPMMLDKVLRASCETYSVLPRCKFNAYAHHEGCASIRPGVIMVKLPGKSWNGWDSVCLNFLMDNVQTLAIIGVLSILAIIVGFFWVLRRWRRLKNTRCQKVVTFCAENPQGDIARLE